MAANPAFHARTKHIEIDLHFVRDKVLGEEIKIEYVPIEEQIVDVFIKPLNLEKFDYFRNKLKVTQITSGLRGDVKRNGPLNEANNAQGIQSNSKAYLTHAQFSYPFQIAENDQRQVQCNCINIHCNNQMQYKCKENHNTFCGDDSIFYLYQYKQNVRNELGLVLS